MALIKGRFGIVPAAWLEDPEVGVNELGVLAALATYADRDGWLFPGQKTIADKVGRSRSNVNKIIARLCRLGYLQKHRQVRRDGGETRCLYRLLYDYQEAAGTEASSAEEHGCERSPAREDPGPATVAEVQSSQDGASGNTGAVPERTGAVLPGTPIRPMGSSSNEVTPHRATTPPQTSSEGRPKRAYRPGSRPIEVGVQLRAVPDDWHPSAADLAWISVQFPRLCESGIADLALQFGCMARAQGWRYASFGDAFRLWLKRHARVESATNKEGRYGAVGKSVGVSRGAHGGRLDREDRRRRRAETFGAMLGRESSP